MLYSRGPCGEVCKLRIAMNHRETMVTLFGLRTGAYAHVCTLVQPQTLEIQEMKRADHKAQERDAEAQHRAKAMYVM